MLINIRTHHKNTFWKFSASLSILLRWLFCPDNLRYGLQKPSSIMAKYLKISLKPIFEMSSSVPEVKTKYATHPGEERIRSGVHQIMKDYPPKQ